MGRLYYVPYTDGGSWRLQDYFPALLRGSDCHTNLCHRHLTFFICLFLSVIVMELSFVLLRLARPLSFEITAQIQQAEPDIFYEWDAWITRGYSVC